MATGRSAKTTKKNLKKKSKLPVKPETPAPPADARPKRSKLERERLKLADPVAGAEYLKTLRKRFLIQTLRRASMRWPPKGIAQQDARVAPGLYACAGCGKHVRDKDKKMDHKVPVVDPALGFTDWEDYTVRMFCSTDGYQALCEPCHDAKTAAEDSQRPPKPRRS